MTRSASSVPARGVQSWLERDPAFRDLARQVDGLLTIQRALQKACPGVPVSVASLDSGTLAVTVPGAAWATRLRQTEPSLVAALRRAGLKVERLKIRPRRGAEVAPRRTAPKAALPPQALAALDALRRTVAPSPLQQALADLVDRHAGRRR